MIEIRDVSVPIVIVQFSPYNLMHGGLGIARTAGRLGIPVYWVDGGGWAPAIVSRYVRGRFVWDTDAPAETLVEYLLDRGSRIGARAVLIPVDDIAAGFVEDHAEVLRERFLFPHQPAGLARRLSNKRELHFLCKEAGVPTPEAAFPLSREEAADFGTAAAFPVVLKRIAWTPEHREQMKSVAVVDGPGELLEEYDEMATPGEPNVMLQEYIPGGPESVWMFNGYFARDSECLAGFTGKKIRQAPPSAGATTLGVCLGNEVVEKTTVAFLRGLGYSGIVDMDYRYDQRDGEYKLLDVNPRVGATFRLFVDSNGMDVVRALYLDLTGRPVRRGVPREGRKWVVEQSDLMAALQYARMKQLTPGKWARSLRGVREGAWFAPDDPIPFVAMGWTSLVKAGGRLRASVRTSSLLKRPGRKSRS